MTEAAFKTLIEFDFKRINNLSPTVIEPFALAKRSRKTTVQAPVAGKTARANKGGLNVRRVV